jgi:hypothetical protein
VVLEPARAQVAAAVDRAAEGDFRGAAAAGVKAIGVAVTTGIAVGELGAAAVDAVKPAGDSVGPVPKPSKGPGAVSPADRDPKRLFSRTQVKEALENQGGCAGCGKPVDTSAAKGHHVKRHADGGQTTTDNLSAVCEDCHKEIHK